MVDTIHRFIRNVVNTMPNFTINDVLETDYDLLMTVMLEESKQQTDEVMELSDFIKSI